MTKREQYGLTFNKTETTEGDHVNFVAQKIALGYNSSLTFISLLDELDCESFINDLNGCLRSQKNIDDGFYSGHVEHIDIVYNYPDVIIEDTLTISMIDMIALLQEWVAFINS